MRIADETLTDVHGGLPLLKPLSQVVVIGGVAPRCQSAGGVERLGGKITCTPVAHDLGYDDTAPELALA